MRAYRPADRRETIGMLARAFSIDPLFDFFARDLLHEQRLMPSLQGAYLYDLQRHGSCHVVTDEQDRARGFAGWLPPDALPRSVKRDAILTLMAASGIVRSKRPVAATRLFLAVDAVHPHEPHHYLAVLAVDPTLQGRGLGRQLITPGLEAADADGLPCYLETQKEANLAWYARFGFTTREVVQVGRTPPVWCLWREPR